MQIQFSSGDINILVSTISYPNIKQKIEKAFREHAATKKTVVLQRQYDPCLLNLFLNQSQIFEIKYDTVYKYFNSHLQLLPFQRLWKNNK